MQLIWCLAKGYGRNESTTRRFVRRFSRNHFGNTWKRKTIDSKPMSNRTIVCVCCEQWLICFGMVRILFHKVQTSKNQFRRSFPFFIYCCLSALFFFFVRPLLAIVLFLLRWMCFASRFRDYKSRNDRDVHTTATTMKRDHERGKRARCRQLVTCFALAKRMRLKGLIALTKL